MSETEFAELSNFQNSVDPKILQILIQTINQLRLLGLVNRVIGITFFVGCVELVGVKVAR